MAAENLTGADKILLSRCIDDTKIKQITPSNVDSVGVNYINNLLEKSRSKKGGRKTKKKKKKKKKKKTKKKSRNKRKRKKR